MLSSNALTIDIFSTKSLNDTERPRFPFTRNWIPSYCKIFLNFLLWFSSTEITINTFLLPTSSKESILVANSCKRNSVTLYLVTDSLPNTQRSQSLSFAKQSTNSSQLATVSTNGSMLVNRLLSSNWIASLCTTGKNIFLYSPSHTYHCVEHGRIISGGAKSNPIAMNHSDLEWIHPSSGRTVRFKICSQSSWVPINICQSRKRSKEWLRHGGSHPQ